MLAPRDDRQALTDIEARLARLDERLAHVEAELSKLRDWRHDLVDKFSALTYVPGQLADIARDIRDTVARLHDIERRLAALDAERAARERAGVWLRWLIPSGWVAAALAALAAWWHGRH